MGGLTALTSNLGLISQGVGLVQDVIGSQVSSNEQNDEQALALQQLQAQQALSQQQQAQSNALEREQIAIQAGIDDEERRDALKRAVARQRAQFGSSGISQGAGGSSQAVLLGLFDEAEGDLQNREALDNLRNRALDLSASQTNSVNVLQREQLLQSQRVNSASQTLDRVNDGIGLASDALNIVSGNRLF